MKKGLILGLLAAGAAAAAAVIYKSSKNKSCGCDAIDADCDDCCCGCDDDYREDCDNDDFNDIPADKAEDVGVVSDACACTEEEIFDKKGLAGFFLQVLFYVSVCLFVFA